jgi:transcriptional regulator with XRE-family HTH domain
VGKEANTEVILILTFTPEQIAHWRNDYPDGDVEDYIMQSVRELTDQEWSFDYSPDDINLGVKGYFQKVAKNTAKDEALALGERFAHAREAAGLSRGQVFNLLGIQPNLLDEIERGNLKPIPEDLTKLAGCYGVSEGFLSGNAPSDMIEELIEHRGAPEHIKLDIIRKWTNPS